MDSVTAKLSVFLTITGPETKVERSIGSGSTIHFNPVWQRHPCSINQTFKPTGCGVTIGTVSASRNRAADARRDGFRKPRHASMTRSESGTA
jgi:hypothetical protein